MSAHVLSNSLNKLGKRHKCWACQAFYLFFPTLLMRGLPSILSLFGNKFNKFNNTRAEMFDPIYHMTKRLTMKSHFCRNNIIILSFCMQRCNGRHNISRNL